MVQGARERTLTDLEGKDWGPPTHDSRLVVECHRSRHVPLKDLSVEDLRLLIGQAIGLPHLVPLALDVLEHDPWAEGDMYAGDLLKVVAEIPPTYWSEQPQMVARFQTVLDGIDQHGHLYTEKIRPAWLRVLGGT